MLTSKNHMPRRLRVKAAIVLLGLAACADDATLSMPTPASFANQASGPVTITPLGLTSPVGLRLRGSINGPSDNNPSDSNDTSRSLIDTLSVPSLGPDEDVATASIAKALAVKPDFDVSMGFAPGDGAEALSTAMRKALIRSAPPGHAGHFHVRGEVTLSSTDTGDTGISIDWQVAHADGALIGTITQTSAVSPSKIAGIWGDFADSAVAPAAQGVRALLSPVSRHEGNAS